MASVTQQEAQQVEQADAIGRTPVVFVHGLWLLRAAGIAGRSCSRRPGTRR